MATLATIAFYLGVIAYSAASTLFFLDLARRDGFGMRSVWAPRVLGVAGALHATHVLTASVLSRLCPVESLHFGLSFSALMAVGAYLLVYRRASVYATGPCCASRSRSWSPRIRGVEAPAHEGVSRPFSPFIAASLARVGSWSRVLRPALSVSGAPAEAQALGRLMGACRRSTPRSCEHGLLVAGFPLLPSASPRRGVFATYPDAGGAEWFAPCWALPLGSAGAVLCCARGRVRGRRAA